MFKNAWKQRSAQVEQSLSMLKLNLKQIDKQVEDLVDRIIQTNNSRVTSVYETKIENLEREKYILNEKIQGFSIPNKKGDKFIELSMQFLANPWNIWKIGDYNLKRIVLRLAFSEPVAYYKNEGYRTPKTSLPFKVLEDFSTRKVNLVGTLGLTLVNSSY